MIATHCNEDGVSGRIVLRPNLSASWRTNVIFMSLLLAVMLLIALMFVALGAWPVLPFAGAEGVFIVLVLYFWYCRYAQQEVLSFDAAYLMLQRGQHHPKQSWRFERFWLRCEVSRVPPALPRVHLACREQRLEIGRFLNEADKLELIRQLRRFIRLS